MEIMSFQNGEDPSEATSGFGNLVVWIRSRSGEWDAEFALRMGADGAMVEVGLVEDAAQAALPYVHDC